MRHISFFLALAALPGSVLPARADETPATPSRWKHLEGKTVVFVANGSGGALTISDGLNYLVRHDGFPLVVWPVPWSRYREMTLDYADHQAQLSAAECLAGSVSLLHHECPSARVVMVGYSSGSRVVLAAAEQCPAGSIDRIVLLGPSVSCYYDLRPALRATCGSIDCYYSVWDEVLLTASRKYGTADGKWTQTAGQIGFWIPGPRKDFPEYVRLRQYPWQETLGGQGGHFSWTRDTFLRNTLAPALSHSASVSP